MKKVFLLLLLLYPFSGYAQSCENLFYETPNWYVVGVRKAKVKTSNYSSYNIREAQTTYLRRYFPPIATREKAPPKSLRNVASNMGLKNPQLLQMKIDGENLMTFPQITMFAKVMKLSPLEVLIYVTDLQARNSSDLKFYPIIKFGSYRDLAENKNLPLQQRILLAQQKHLRRLMELTTRENGFAEVDFAYIMGISEQSLLSYMGLYKMNVEIPFINALKLADALNIDVRDVFSFLQDFEGQTLK